jgi:iron complex outermembrane recepter protein
MDVKTRNAVRLAIALGSLPVWLAAEAQTPAPQTTAVTEGEYILEEIVVTAQKREESLRDVPLSVEAVLGDKLTDAGILRLDDLKGYVPNLQMSETGIANNIYIRGIGSGLNQGFEQSVSLYQDGVYHGRGHQSRMPFVDLARVEVLRGPQPILFGKNSVAGTVNMVANVPTQELEAMGRVARDVENDETTADLVLSGPFTDSLRGRLAMFHRHADGYLSNDTLGTREPRRNDVGGRFTLQADIGDALTATLRFEAGKFDTDGRQIEIFGETPIPTGVGLPFEGATYSQALAGVIGAMGGTPPAGLNEAGGNGINYRRGATTENFSNNDSREAALTFEYQLGNGATLTSNTAFSKYQLEEGCDCDFVAAPLVTAGITEDYQQYSQELRISSPQGERMQWIGGLFFQTYSLDETDFLHVPVNSVAPFLVSELLRRRGLCTVPVTINPAGDCGQRSAPFRGAVNPRQFEQDSDLFSAFLQATFQFDERWSLTAGGRLNREKKTGSRAAQLGGPNFPPATAPQYGQVLGLFDGVLGIFPHAQSGSRKETNFSPLVNVQFRPTDATMLYASASQGYKSGGFDTRSNRASNYVDPNPAAPVEQPGTFEFEDERATTYELGLKSAIGNRAEINAAAFFTDYKDLQTSVFDGRIGFNVGNGSAEVRGVELEGRWRPVGALLLSGSVAALDFEWKNYTGQCYYDIQYSTFIASGGVASQSNCDYAGRSNQFAPDVTGVLSAQYSWNLGRLVLTTTGDLLYSDDYLQSPNLDPTLVQQSFTKFNARVSLGDANERWELALVGRNLTDKTTVSYAADAPLAFTLFRARSYYGFVDPPRAIAIEGRVRF